MSTEDSTLIKAHPTKDFFISILIRDITIRDAIGDLLDNSVDGALELRRNNTYEGLFVNIVLDPTNDRFIIEDNCGGIPHDVAKNYAFRFGRAKGADSTGHSVGVFGIGMKRALFRLGKQFSIESTAKNSRFTMEVDVNQWEADGDDSSWHFNFKTEEPNVPEDIPEAERGTRIVVSKLLPDVAVAFEIGEEITDLIGELQREHVYSINQGLKVTVNNQLLEAPQFRLLHSNNIKPAYWEGDDGPVHIEIYAGIAEQEKFGPNGGWYIFCNKRLVLGPDTTKVTGWGADKPDRIPKYHSQFYRFRGYVYLDATEPRNLPWNTTKTSVDTDSPTYRRVRQKMIQLMHTVTDFLNQLHRENQDYRKDIIIETPTRVAIDQAKPVALDTLRADPQKFFLIERFEGPPPARPAQPTFEQESIRYVVSKKRYDAVRRYFKTDSPQVVGLETFDYFYEREIGD